MRKILACAFVATTLCLAFAGCSGNANAPEPSSVAAESSSAATDDESTAHAALPATLIADGTYGIEVDSSSSMFRVVDAQLTVSGDSMECAMTLSGTGYGKLFMGTGEEALTAPESAFIPFVENAEGAYVYTVPVEALDADTACAAYSIRKEQWYDRTLVFKSDTLPADAILSEPKEAAAGNADAVEALKAQEAGTYAVDVTLAGGTGKASIESPAILTVDENGMTARIAWSSSSYDQMTVDGVEYLPVNDGGNSTFEIPVAALDQEMPVSARTTAMSKPHTIDYTLTFDSASASRSEA